MLCDAITKIRSLGPSFHNCNPWLKVEGGSLVGHDGHQEDGQGGGHVGLRGLKGLLPFTTPAPLPQCRHCDMLTSLYNHILCVLSVLHHRCCPPSIPTILHSQWCTGLRVPSSLLAGWCVTTCRAQVCQPPAAHCWPDSWAGTGPGASGGTPQHPPLPP